MFENELRKLNALIPEPIVTFDKFHYTDMDGAELLLHTLGLYFHKGMKYYKKYTGSDDIPDARVIESDNGYDVILRTVEYIF